MIPVYVVVPTYQRREKLDACVRSLLRQTHRTLSVSWVEDTQSEYAIGIWNRLAPTVTEGAFVYLCDDVELAPDCIERAADTLLRRYQGDGVIGFRQTNITQAKAAMGMIGARFLDRFEGRRPFCPEYTRFHFDSELGRAAQKLGRFHADPTACLIHHHPEHTETPADAAHERVREPSAVEADNATWQRRKAEGRLWGYNEGVA